MYNLCAVGSRDGLKLGAVFTHTVSGVLPNIKTFLLSIKTLLNIISLFGDNLPEDLGGSSGPGWYNFNEVFHCSSYTDFMMVTSFIAALCIFILACCLLLCTKTIRADFPIRNSIKKCTDINIITNWVLAMDTVKENKVPISTCPLSHCMEDVCRIFGCASVASKFGDVEM